MNKFVTDFDNLPPGYLAQEMALLNIGDFEPLDIKINHLQLKKELDQFRNDWVEYLPKEYAPNHMQMQQQDGKRKSLSVCNLPGRNHNDAPCVIEASKKANRIIKESEFNSKTLVYEKCPSIQGIVDAFDTVGRTFIVRLNAGGNFPPHRDYPSPPRNCFRVVVFINNCGTYEYDWIMGERNKVSIELGRAYFVNTNKTHRIMSWTNNSIKLIMNVPYTSNNVNIVLQHLQQRV